jgi:hypothetical protein
MYSLLLSYIIAARYYKKPVKDLLPPGVLKGADYFGMYISTVGKAARLSLSDGCGSGIGPEFPSMFAYATGDVRWNKLALDALSIMDMEAMIKQPGFITWGGYTVLSAIFGPDDLMNQKEIVPTFKIHASSGHATSCRITENGAVRFHICGSSSTEGHSHEDKGSFILEAFGESIFIDRGTPIYSDSLLDKFKYARMHNLITVLDSNGIEQRQTNPCTSEVIPTGSGDNIKFNIEIDTSPAWGKPVISMQRKIDSPEFCLFNITDDIELEYDAPVVFNLHSYYPINIENGYAEFTSLKTRVKVEWEWDGVVISSGEELFDGEHKPVYHLAVKSVPQKHHSLITHIKLCEAN